MAIGKTKLKKLQSIISKRGQNPVIGTIYNMQQIWLSWYRGNVNNFHRYNVKISDGTTQEIERKTLNMAKKVCEDWTTLLFNEKVDITVDDTAINEEVQKVLKDNNFVIDFANMLEKTFALGNGATIEFLEDNEIIIDYITGDLFLVTAYRNTNVTGICTVNEIQMGEEWVTHLTFHDINKGIYRIEHQVFVSKSQGALGDEKPVSKIFTEEEVTGLTMTDEDGVITFGVEYKTNIPHFQLYRPNITGNYDIDSPLGISIFANSIDQLKAADNKYDSFDTEYELARYRIIVDDKVAKEKQVARGAGVQRIQTFDTKDRLYVGGNLDMENSIQIYQVPIRATEHIDGVNNDVQRIGFTCGMGTDYYSFDARGVYQNEKAVVSENSDLWAAKKKHEQIIVKNLENMVRSILFLLKETGVIAGDIEPLEIIIKTDDSVIIDDEALYQKDLDLNDRGSLAMWEILVKWFGLTPEEAKLQIANAELENGGAIEPDDDSMTPTEDETEEEFIQRFMSDSNMALEFKDEEQRRTAAQETFANSGS